MTPEAQARERIDELLALAGWVVQDRAAVNLATNRGVAVRELSFDTGEPDYTLFVDGKALGTAEAKPVGHSLLGVAEQSSKYGVGLPAGMAAWRTPLPFTCESTGEETWFANHRDPEPRSRKVFAFHRPETLLEWAQEAKPLAQRLRELPPLLTSHLWSAQVQAIANLERSFAAGRQRALIQMATGSGKTFTAVNFVYRLIKHARVRRVLFLVDRGNLGTQTLKEFQQFRTPDDGRTFTELYNVQHLRANALDPVARVTIATIQRLYSMLKGESEAAPDLDDLPVDAAEQLYREPLPVAYNPALPVETFDVIVTDECHRSIYNLWRQVLEYFDASIVGLTATPSKQTRARTSHRGSSRGARGVVRCGDFAGRVREAYCRYVAPSESKKAPQIAAYRAPQQTPGGMSGLSFFHQNLVLEYGHERAVADGVNVNYDVYRIRTRITEQGSTVDSGFWVDRRDRLTRAHRWQQLDEELTYDATAARSSHRGSSRGVRDVVRCGDFVGRAREAYCEYVAPSEPKKVPQIAAYRAPQQTPGEMPGPDRAVVAEDQIRTVLVAFRDGLFTDLFPGRSDVPKTLIFAKDDSHADDIVRICREVFDKGNDFCQKITYKTTGVSPLDLIASFRTSYFPRIAVTVDMIATGTDIKPLEVVFFMRSVRSASFFEQMKGRGVRVVTPTELQGVTPDARAKTHFVVVDAVGVCEQDKGDSRPLERKRNVPFAKLLEAVALGNRELDALESLAGRLLRLERQLDRKAADEVEALAGGSSLGDLARSLLLAVDPDTVEQAARAALPEGRDPSPAQLAETQQRLADQAAAPLATRPDLRSRLVDLQRSSEQTIDTVSQDLVLEAGFSAAALDAARSLVRSWEEYVAANRDELTAIQLLYTHGKRLRYEQLKELASSIERPPRQWTPDRLWAAYEKLRASAERRARPTTAATKRVLTDLVTLVRVALHEQEDLVPFVDSVRRRFDAWLAQQDTAGRTPTPEDPPQQAAGDVAEPSA